MGRQFSMKPKSWQGRQRGGGPLVVGESPGHYALMAIPTRLLTLDLRSAIDFPEALTLAMRDGDFFPGGPADEGDEELHRFDLDLLASGPDGPRCRRPLPLPLASHRRSRPKGAAKEAQTEVRLEPGLKARLQAGLWLFTQWRPADGGELAEGIEWFAREAWWEGRELEGGLFLRLVREDGRLAFQLLMRLAPPSS